MKTLSFPISEFSIFALDYSARSTVHLSQARRQWKHGICSLIYTGTKTILCQNLRDKITVEQHAAISVKHKIRLLLFCLCKSARNQILQYWIAIFQISVFLCFMCLMWYILKYRSLVQDQEWNSQRQYESRWPIPVNLFKSQLKLDVLFFHFFFFFKHTLTHTWEGFTWQKAEQ